MRLRQTAGESRDSKRLLETHKTQIVYCRLMRISKTNGDSEADSWGLMRLKEATVDS